jgi:hypothetical protein
MGARFISSVGQLPSSFDMQYYMRFIWYVVLIGENTETQFYIIHTQVNFFWKFNKLVACKKGEILWKVMLWWNINIKSLSVKEGLQLLKTLREYLKWQEVLWQHIMNGNWIHIIRLDCEVNLVLSWKFMHTDFEQFMLYLSSPSHCKGSEIPRNIFHFVFCSWVSLLGEQCLTHKNKSVTYKYFTSRSQAHPMLFEP